MVSHHHPPPPHEIEEYILPPESGKNVQSLHFTQPQPWRPGTWGRSDKNKY